MDNQTSNLIDSLNKVKDGLDESRKFQRRLRWEMLAIGYLLGPLVTVALFLINAQ